LIAFSDHYSTPWPSVVEICSCGHPLRNHTMSTCEGSRGTCQCRKLHPLLVVKNAESFRKAHTSVGVGHALIQGLLDYPGGLDQIGLSKRDLGRNPECYRCGVSTPNLMPILVNRHSTMAVHEVSRGRMTRLWCDKCCEREDIEFLPHLANVIKFGLIRRRNGEDLVP
jgi:hypothetical protein